MMDLRPDLFAIDYFSGLNLPTGRDKQNFDLQEP